MRGREGSCIRPIYSQSSISSLTLSFHLLSFRLSLILSSRTFDQVPSSGYAEMSQLPPMTSQVKTVQLARSRSLEQRMPLLLRPVVRAYVLGYASSTTPRILTLLLTHLSRRRKNIDEKPDDHFLHSLIRILRGGLELQRFPTFCAALVGGSTLLEARDNV